MARPRVENYRRPYEEVRSLMLPRARELRNPFEFTSYQEIEQAFAALTTLDRDAWAETFSAVARPYEARAQKAEARGDSAEAQRCFLLAYNYYRVARYPAPNSSGKRAAYLRERESYLRAARSFDPPLEIVEMPFQGRPGEGKAIPGYLRRPPRAPHEIADFVGTPPGPGPLPLVVLWGGIDGFKEEARADPYLQRGLAVLAIDMPGTGEAPLAGSVDAERLWDAVFDWVERHPDLDAGRVAVRGASTGGYWATKVAHTHRHRIVAAVNHGGPAHFAFQPAWVEQATHGEYPFELAETLAAAFGLSTFEEWVEYAPRLSLLSQGLLDGPSAPLLCVNGVEDSIFPIADHYLLLEHGEPKAARFFPGGHMGRSPEVFPTIVGWIARALGA